MTLRLGALFSCATLLACTPRPEVTETATAPTVLRGLSVADAWNAPRQVYVGDEEHDHPRLLTSSPIRLPERTTQDPPAQFWVAGRRLEARRFRPGNHAILIVPERWRVPISGRDTFIRTETILPNRWGAPALIPSALRLWGEQPVPVAVRRTSSLTSLSARHPTGFVALTHRAVRLINVMAGDEVLAYTADSELVGTPSRGIRVTPLRASSDPKRQGITHLDQERPVCEYEALRYACVPQWTSTASVSVAPAAGVPVMVHELLHALGLSHTCVIRSIMATEFSTRELSLCGLARGGLGFSEPLELEREASVYDAAALRLLRAAAVALSGSADGTVHWLLVPQ